MELLWAEGAYMGGFCEWLRRQLGWRLEVPHHPDRQLWRYGLEEKPHGFQVLPRRWVVERTFAWMGLSRRFSKDYERLCLKPQRRGSTGRCAGSCCAAWRGQREPFSPR